MNSFLLLALLFTFSTASSPKELYVDQSTSYKADEQDGSMYYPYSSLEAAFKAINFGTINIVLVGQSYTVNQLESFTTDDATNEIIINIKASEGFTLRFSEQGQILCTNFQQNIITPLIKNVNISFTGFNIETQSTKPLFYGDCYFTFKDIFIEELQSPFLMTKSEGSALLQNLTIKNIVLGEDQNLIDQDSRERVEADYLILDSVTMKNTAENSATIKSFLQYKRIDVKDSVLEGINFNIKGEEIGGNNKTNITISNVLMQNAENFFFIESYGTLLVENSTFTNTTNRAFYFFLTDENLSPISATFNNCSFEDNIVQFAGGAITYQGSTETNYQFSLNTAIIDCTFTNNKASFSGGALSLLYLKNANVTITGSEFTLNSASESGGAIYINGGESNFSVTITNTDFTSNSAFSGGVFSFEFMNGAQIILTNNTYTNNSAQFEGGIGVTSESLITLTESNSTMTNNSAGFQGGAWSFDSDSIVEFQDVLFKDNSAFLRGGCVANSGASLSLTRVSFEHCSLAAVSSTGGAVFIGEDATATMTDSLFSDNLAEFGAAVAIQSSRGKPLVLEGITLKSDLRDLGNDAPTVKSQIRSGPGDLVLKNIAAPNLKAPFLRQQAGKIDMQNVRIGTINCDAEDDSLSFCVFGIAGDGEESQEFNLEDLQVEDASSSAPLLTSQGSKMSINSAVVNKMKLPEGVPVWDIRDSVVQAEKIQLLDLDNNFVKVVDSDMNVQDLNFELQPEGLESEELESEGQLEENNEEVNQSQTVTGEFALIPKDE